METREKLLEVLDTLNTMDDTFGKKVLGDRECAKFFLGMVTQGSVNIGTVTIGRPISFEGKHDIIEDISIKGDKVAYVIELQRDSRGAIWGRLIYYAASEVIDSLEKGGSYKDVPDVFIICVAEHNVLHIDAPIYRRDVGEELGEGQCLHFIYLNMTYKGDNLLGRLIHDIKCIDPWKMCFPILRNRCLYLKTTDQGRQEMLEGLEGYWKGVYDKGYDKCQGDMRVSLAQDMFRRRRYSIDEVMDLTHLPLNQLLAIKSSMKL